MENLLAITLGTRDIQIRLSTLHHNEWQQEKNLIHHKKIEALSFPGYLPPGFADTFCLSQPRTAGELILEYYETLLPILHFPLLQPVVDFLKKKKIKLDHILLLCTDQKEEYNAGLVKPKDYQNDTLYFGEIVSRFLQGYLSLTKEQVEMYHVTKEVTNMDYLYTHFADKASRFFSIDPYEIDKIYLLPQGGIDHINQAFTLKLIQQFGEKVMQLQQAEAQEPKQLNFPRLFLNDLYRQRRLQHLHDFEFGLLADSIPKGYKELTVAKRLANWANLKLHLNYKELTSALQGLESKIEPDFINWLQNESKDSPLERLKTLWVMCYIQYQQGNMSDLIWRLFTIAENLFKILTEQLLGWPDTKDFYDGKARGGRNENWEKFLGVENVEILRKEGVFIDNPNRYAYKILFFHHYTKMMQDDTEEYGNYLQISAAIELMTLLRNKLAHEMRAVDVVEINYILSELRLNIKDLLEIIRNLLGIGNANFAIVIQDKIRPYLNQ